MQEVVCSICNKPVLGGQARYSVTENHYVCEFPTGQPKIPSFAEIKARVDKALEALTGRPSPRGSKPIGQGAIAMRVKKLVFEALSAYFEGEPVDVKMWVQAPEYRGPRRDLACWGLTCTYNGVTVTVHSWSTMTQCAKSKRLSISPDGIMTFDVGPTTTVSPASKRNEPNIR